MRHGTKWGTIAGMEPVERYVLEHVTTGHRTRTMARESSRSRALRLARDLAEKMTDGIIEVIFIDEDGGRYLLAVVYPGDRRLSYV